MRARRPGGIVVIALGIGAACAKAAGPAETVSTTTLPPIETCYEPDGAPCPLPPDGGDDGGDGGLDADAEAGPG